MSDIDKSTLYANFQRQADQRCRLGLQAARKALDIADDDMNINANRSGISASGAIGIALASGLAPALLAGALLLRGDTAGVKLAAPAQQAVTAPVAAAPAAPVIAVYDGRIVQEERKADGSWRFLWSLPARRLPDGTAETNDGRKWKPGKDGQTWEEVQ